jgi:hypothetical protein
VDLADAVPLAFPNGSAIGALIHESVSHVDEVDEKNGGGFDHCGQRVGAVFHRFRNVYLPFRITALGVKIAGR